MVLSTSLYSLILFHFRVIHVIPYMPYSVFVPNQLCTIRAKDMFLREIDIISAAFLKNPLYPFMITVLSTQYRKNVFC